MNILIVASIVNFVLTVFMAFLTWLSWGSKDSFAFKLRVFGYVGVASLWVIILIFPECFEILGWKR